MRFSINRQDVTAIRIHLNELKSKFDNAIRSGESFSDVKQIHSQIKELETKLNAMSWHPGSEENRHDSLDQRGLVL